MTLNIQGAEVVKLSQYADDTTALLADVQSVSNLFNLLSLFEKCSGLKINQTKSEMLWLGSLRHRKDAIFNLQISDEQVYALGEHFTYNIETYHKKNFLEKLGPLKKTLSIWSSCFVNFHSDAFDICQIVGTGSTDAPPTSWAKPHEAISC